jgi:hypothetical protein
MRRREAEADNGTLIDDLHGHLYLSGSDVVPFLVLLSLETGIEIECCKGLATNCLKNPTADSVEIEYCKRRTRGAEWHRLRVRDGSSGTPGGLVRMILRLTERARRFLTDRPARPPPGGRNRAAARTRTAACQTTPAHSRSTCSITRPVRLSGTENRHKAIQKSHAEVGFLGGLIRPST